MKLYTSYWAMVRFFPKNLVGLNSTVWPPKWRPLGQDKRGVICIDCPPLKPGSSCSGLCRGECSPKNPQDCAFLNEYRKQLDCINIHDFLAQLELLKDRIEEGEGINNVDFAIIVFEKNDNPCSERIVIQQWLRDNGIEINEWKKEME